MDPLELLSIHYIGMVGILYVFSMIGLLCATDTDKEDEMLQK
jgi:hypothetical protein